MKRMLVFTIALALRVGVMAQTTGAATGNVILISPTDGQVINTFNPSFFWTFTGPVGDYQTTYSIKITELREGQTYADAIGLNVPLVFEINLMQPGFMYPFTAPALDENKRYVWQVEASIYGRVKYLSEIWMFRFDKNKTESKDEDIKEKPKTYVHLSKGVNNGTHLFTDKVNFRYNNETIDTILDYVIYQTGKKEMMPLTKAPVKMRPGINYISLEAPKNAAQANKKAPTPTYILEVRNSRKERWLLKFSVISKSKTNR